MLVQAIPMAHQGFLARAQHVPAEQLYAHAQSQSKRLVFSGERTMKLSAALSARIKVFRRLLMAGACSAQGIPWAAQWRSCARCACCATECRTRRA